MVMILRIASSRIVGQGDIVGRSGYFSLNLSANSVMRGRLDARRTLKSLVADLRYMKDVEIYLEQDIRMDMDEFYNMDATIFEDYINVGKKADSISTLLKFLRR